MIRKIYLENPSGNKFYFDYRSGCLIHAISGLGFSQEMTYLKYETFYDRVDQTQGLTEIQATLTFLKGYPGYTELMNYLKLGEKELKLYYEADDSAFCFVDIKSISKQELVAGTLQSQIIFQKLSLWLKNQLYTVNVNEDTVGKRYAYNYPYRYSAFFEGKIQINNRGVQKAPLLIEIMGAVSDPEIIIRKNSSVITMLRLYHTQINGEIHISAIPNKQYIRQIDNGEVISIYGSQDFTCDNFLFVEPGEYEIEFKPGVASLTTCRITLLEGYLGV
jgi:cytoskeletal protein CcmA (bactofilin family)